MEDCKNDTRKRVRDDSDDADSNESKRVVRVDSFSDVNLSESCVDSDGSESEIVRVESEPDSYEVNDMTDEILNILDETDNVPERETTVTAVQGLDSVIKSFEDEIFASGEGLDPNQLSDSGEFNPNLGYLLEASDDELGLPPTMGQTEEKVLPEINDSGRVGPDGVDLSGFYWFEEEIRNNEGFGLMGYDNTVGDENDGAYVTIDGLFDYGEPTDLLWRSESLQAM